MAASQKRYLSSCSPLSFRIPPCMQTTRTLLWTAKFPHMERPSTRFGTNGLTSTSTGSPRWRRPSTCAAHSPKKISPLYNIVTPFNLGGWCIVSGTILLACLGFLVVNAIYGHLPSTGPKMKWSVETRNTAVGENFCRNVRANSWNWQVLTEFVQCLS